MGAEPKPPVPRPSRSSLMTAEEKKALKQRRAAYLARESGELHINYKKDAGQMEMPNLRVRRTGAGAALILGVGLVGWWFKVW
mmetsp:Transcript_10655/g.32622  ORF Transcript_10655/g.32622 Transcript_10655/m.32622 type:complete len:83 (+) Transcript_10655:192-440(+)|eukprot:CAMPEP_0198730764 /NCGR_PEP_ID=MMETSP1475-20131203/26143_1 /TAXON_ID= ORGANISM="Unidentified sp., Strain CCMP1999" /NCGR_SAMPLE_ID=MMETSP1475 /ASSEMBLY_ACC=CAM_ASM_001111 /LENGTH=82 /DNA_ID=CAMNT_0044493621 /DNA_START=112 /DNA_END=360 /DNA_ORIENTATION=-